MTAWIGWVLFFFCMVVYLVGYAGALTGRFEWVYTACIGLSPVVIYIGIRWLVRLWRSRSN